MSLSSFLLGSAKRVDSELDSLFKSAPTPIAIPTTTPAKPPKDVKRKRKLDEGADKEERKPTASAKRAKSSPVKEAREAKKAGKAKAAEKTKEEVVKVDKTKVAEKEGKKEKKKKGMSKQVEVDDEDGDENSDLENAYLQAQEKAPAASSKDAEKDSDAEEDDDEEFDPSNLVHESVAGKKTRGGKTKLVKYIPEDETAEQKDQRTIFIGNLPLEVAQKRPLLKQLQKHILALVPNAKIESTRFRSVPFQTPTSKLPTSDDEATPAKTRQHNIARMAAWRLNSKDEEEAKEEKKFLNKNQKKKIAFINHEFHTSADSVNAYVVFSHPVPPGLQHRAPNVPPPKEVMDPYEAAREAVEKGDGTLFMERLIRVDLVGSSGVKGGGKEEKKPTGAEPDPKLSIFVGNLDFASKEEDLRVFFEGVVSAERGPPLEEDVEVEVEGEGVVKKPRTWVTRARIVRDRDTQLGKGFAYVQFSDRECIDEILTLEADKLKFAKRKLRVERCKTLPGASTKISLSSAPKTNSSDSKQARPARVEVPKGDPALGEKLASLSKEERKKAKATDADRVARRLAKKKARMAMGPVGGVKDVLGKDRKRERKDRKGEKGGKEGRNSGRKEGGRRVRSERSIGKKNAKK